jgi:hypothetical protein
VPSKKSLKSSVPKLGPERPPSKWRLDDEEEIVGNRLNTSFIMARRDAEFERWLDSIFRDRLELNSVTVRYEATLDENAYPRTSQGYRAFDGTRILVPGKPRSFTRWNISYRQHPNLSEYIQKVCIQNAPSAYTRPGPHEDPHIPENHPSKMEEVG